MSAGMLRADDPDALAENIAQVGNRVARNGEHEDADRLMTDHSEPQ
jgi:hypothetical protein